MTTVIGSAPGHGNLPNGNWSPTLYSKELIKFNRRASVAEAITNNRYTGEITGLGSELKILLEPELTVTAHVRGQEVVPQALSDEQITMLIDQAFNVAFKVDDIETLMSHINWGSELESQMVYQLRNKFDQNVLQAIFDGSTTNADLGTNASPITVGHSASATKPSDYILKFATKMRQNDVPEEDRWFVASPTFYEKLYAEDSAFMDASYMGSGMSEMEAGKFALNKKLHGFTLFMSNNLPAAGTATNEIILAGHQNAVSTAQALLKSNMVEMEKEFGMLYKSLHVFGRKVIQSENLFSGHAVI